MYFRTVYDTGHPDAWSAMQLMLKLEYAMHIDTPWGEEVVGILKEVVPMDSNRLVTLVFEIDDAYECHFYVNHSSRDMALIVDGSMFREDEYVPCLEEC